MRLHLASSVSCVLPLAAITTQTADFALFFPVVVLLFLLLLLPTQTNAAGG